MLQFVIAASEGPVIRLQNISIQAMIGSIRSALARLFDSGGNVLAWLLIATMLFLPAGDTRNPIETDVQTCAPTK